MEEKLSWNLSSTTYQTEQKQQNQLEGGLNQGGSNGEGERWSNSKYILKVELTGFVNGLECKVSEQEKMSRCFHLSNWKNGVATD